MKRLTIIFWFLFAVPVTAAAAEGRIDFSLPDIHGKIHTLSQYAGKWVVINYWATSCPPCIKEIPELVAFHRQHQDHDVVLLGVNFEDISLSWLKDFMDSVAMNYTVLRSDPSQKTPFGIVIALPTTFIVSPAGQLVARQVGPVTAADLDAFFKRKARANQSQSPATRINNNIR